MFSMELFFAVTSLIFLACVIWLLVTIPKDY